MENLVRDLLRDPATILRGLPLRWDDIVPENREKALIAALHCVLNGPVGVNKNTRFPKLTESTSIKSVVNVSNKSWREFCREVAEIVKRLYPDLQCSTKSRNGDYWPLAEWRRDEQII
jgi:hypothetical protein